MLQLLQPICKDPPRICYLPKQYLICTVNIEKHCSTRLWKSIRNGYFSKRNIHLFFSKHNKLSIWRTILCFLILHKRGGQWTNVIGANFRQFLWKKVCRQSWSQEFSSKSWFHQHQYISSLFLIWRLFSFHRSLLTFTPASYLSANKSRKKIKVLHLVHILDWDTILFVDHETIYNISKPLYSKCLNHST